MGGVRVVSLNADVELLRLHDLARAARAARDTRQEAYLCNQIGSVYEKLGKWQKALGHHRRDATLSRDGAWLPGLAVALMNVGRCLRMLGEYAEAKSHLLEQLELGERLGDLLNQQRACCELGNTWVDEFQGTDAGARAATDGLSEAREFYRRSLQLAEHLPDGEDEKNDMILAAYNNLGLVHDLLREKDAALEWYTRHMRRAQQLGDQEAEARVCYNMGLIYGEQSHHRKAIDLFERHLAINKKLKNVEEQADGAVALVKVLCDMGDYAAARTRLRAVQTMLAARPGDAARKQSIDDWIDLVRARERLQAKVDDARARLAQLGHRAEHSAERLGALMRLSRLLTELERPDNEVEAVQVEAMALLNERPAGQEGVGLFLRRYGDFLEDRERFAEALFVRRRELAVPGLPRDDQAYCLHNIATLLDSLDKPVTQVIETYEQALAIAVELANKRLEAQVCSGLAFVLAKAGRKDDAARFDRRSEHLQDQLAVADDSGSGSDDDTASDTSSSQQHAADPPSSPGYGGTSSDLDYDIDKATATASARRLQRRHDRQLGRSSDASSDDDLVAAPVPMDIDRPSRPPAKPRQRRQQRPRPIDLDEPVDRDGKADEFNQGFSGQRSRVRVGEDGGSRPRESVSARLTRVRRLREASSSLAGDRAPPAAPARHQPQLSRAPPAQQQQQPPTQQRPRPQTERGVERVYSWDELLGARALPVHVRDALANTGTTVIALPYHDLGARALVPLLVNALDALPGLTTLRLGHCGLDDALLFALAGGSGVLPRLRELDLSANSVSRAGVIALRESLQASAKRQALEVIVLAGNPLACPVDEVLQLVSAAPALRSLNVARCALTALQVPGARRGTALTYFDVSGNPRLDPTPVLRELAPRAPLLCEFNLGACGAAHTLDELVRVLAAFPRLENVDLQHTDLTRTVFARVAEALAGLSGLTVLSLASCRLDDAMVARLAQSLQPSQPLTSLVLSSNPLTASGPLCALFRCCHALTDLAVEHCPLEATARCELDAAASVAGVRVAAGVWRVPSGPLPRV